MKPEEVYAIWSPPDSIWARWSKPVLFTQVREVPEMVLEPYSGDMSWAPKVHQNTAIIVNLPGSESVAMGLALAQMGYRPVPLYNCSNGPSAVVELNGILNGLISGIEPLQRARISPEAPPAFLVDSNRLIGALAPSPGRFDNRWVLFPQDFPSATFFKSRGINRVMVVQNRATPEDDLEQVLYPWKKAGMEIYGKIDQSTRPDELDVRRPNGVRRWYLWYGAFIMGAIGLRRNSAGGFGSIIPMPSSGGG